jgi:hypothetical protein
VAVNRSVTAEEIVAEGERVADESAARARTLAVDALTMGGRFTLEAAETWVRAIEDAVRRDCARRCEAIRAEVEKQPRLTRVARSVARVGDVPQPARIFDGPAAGADACACAIRDSIERGR